MKKLVCLLLLALALAGCDRIIAREYVTVTPHVDQHTSREDEDALTAQNYLSLKNAILSFVEGGVEHGVIRTRDYTGEVEKDLAAAAYEVSKLDPLGAYAVDYMTHSCAQIVSYYEIHIDITFRRTLQQIQSIERIGTGAELPELLERTLAAYAPELTVRLGYYDRQDLEALVRGYYEANPATAMELPEVTVNLYPESGNARIVELLFDYTEPPEALLEKQDAVATSAHAAGEYVRYRDTERGKLQLLYTYLQERFSYRPGESSTPVYSFLCEGVAGNEGCARGLEVLCAQMGLTCETVAGNRSGEPYYWNIVGVDGRYYHIDLLRALLEDAETLPFYTDGTLADYYWDAERYPACPDEETETAGEAETPEDAGIPGEPEADMEGETDTENEEDAAHRAAPFSRAGYEALAFSSSSASSARVMSGIPRSRKYCAVREPTVSEMFSQSCRTSPKGLSDGSAKRSSSSAAYSRDRTSSSPKKARCPIFPSRRSGSTQVVYSS